MATGRLVVSRFWCALLALLLVSCGGGGGGGGNSGGSGNPTLSASTTSVTFTAVQGSAAPATQNVAVSISGGTVFVGVQSITGTGFTAGFTITGTTTGNIAVTPFAPTMAPGTYTGAITIRGCKDAFCSSGDVAGSPKVINVSYTVQAATGLRGTPTNLSFNQTQGGAAPVAQTLGLSDAVGGSYGWNASIIYQSGSGWLTLNGSNTANGVSLPASLQVGVNSSSTLGTVNALVRVTGNDGSTLDVPVSFSVSEPQLSGVPSSLGINASAGGVLPATQAVTLSTAGALSLGYTTSVTYGAGPTGWLSVPSSGAAPGTANVGVNTTALAMGTYNATLFFNTPGGQSFPVSISYTVGASALTFSPSTASFTINTSSTAAALSQTVSVGSSTSDVLSWTASSNQSWVTVSPASGTSGSTVTLSLDATQLDTLDPGLRSAQITFTYTPPGSSQTTSALAVSLDLQLPMVTSVTPYVATSGTSLQVILHGKGLNYLGLGALNFGSTAAPLYTGISDTEMLATHPVLSAGTYRVSFANQLGDPSIVRSTANLVVVDPPVFAATAVAYPNVTPKQALGILYDAERKVLFVGVTYGVEGDSGDLYRYAYSGSAWSAPTIVPVASISDLALSLDGSKVITAGRTITPYDAVTLAAGTSSVPAPGSFGSIVYFFRRLALTHDGNAILTTGFNGSGYSDAYKYSLSSGTLTAAGMTFSIGSIGAGADGSRAVIIQSGVSPAQNLAQYLTSTGTFSTVPVALTGFFADPVVLNRRSNRMLLSASAVYDASFQQLGSIPGAVAGVLSPDGLKAYGYASGVLHTYDLSGTLANPATDFFPEIGTGITLPAVPGNATIMTISPDGGTVFIAGNDGIVVQPVP